MKYHLDFIITNSIFYNFFLILKKLDRFFYIKNSIFLYQCFFFYIENSIVLYQEIIFNQKYIIWYKKKWFLGIKKIIFDMEK